MHATIPHETYAFLFVRYSYRPLSGIIGNGQHADDGGGRRVNFAFWGLECVGG